MRFPFLFQREKGGASPPPALGSDSAPTSAPNPSKDNQTSFRVRDTNGWPLQRLIIGAQCSAGGATMPTVDVYFYEERSAKWFKLTKSSVTLLQNEFVAVDLFAILEPAPTQKSMMNDDGMPSNAGGVDLCFVLADPGAATAGTYTVVVGADVTQLAV